MAGPVTGLVGQQPQVQTFQPGGSNQTRQVREREQSGASQENIIQRQADPRAEAQSVEETRQAAQYSSEKSTSLARNDNTSQSLSSGSGSQGRGSLVDIAV